MKTTGKDSNQMQRRAYKADVYVEGEHDRLLEVERERAHEGIDGVITG